MASFLIGYKEVPVYAIEVEKVPNDNDWEFVFIDAWADTEKLKIKKQMSVF